MPLGTEINVGPGDVVLDGVAAPSKGGTTPSFRPMSVVAKRLDGSMPLGRKVGLGQGDIVLHGDPDPSKGTAPNFRPMSMWPNGRPSQLLLRTEILAQNDPPPPESSEF